MDQKRIIGLTKIYSIFSLCVIFSTGIWAKPYIGRELKNVLKRAGYNLSQGTNEAIACGHVGCIYKLNDKYGNAWALKVLNHNRKESELDKEYRALDRIYKYVGKKHAPKAKWFEHKHKKYLLKKWIDGKTLLEEITDGTLNELKFSKYLSLFHKLCFKLSLNEIILDIHGENVIWDDMSEEWVIIDTSGYAKTYLKDHSILNYYSEQRMYWQSLSRSSNNKELNYFIPTFFGAVEEYLFANSILSPENMDILFHESKFIIESNGLYLSYDKNREDFYLDRDIRKGLYFRLIPVLRGKFEIRFDIDGKDESLCIGYDSSNKRIFPSDDCRLWESFHLKSYSISREDFQIVTYNYDTLDLGYLSNHRIKKFKFIQVGSENIYSQKKKLPLLRRKYLAKNRIYDQDSIRH